jgi:hypothetical protein
MARTKARTACSILVALALGGSAPRGAVRSAAYVPDPSAAGAPAMTNGAWRVEGKGYAAALTLLDDAGRRAYVERRTGSREDPFAPLPGSPSTLLVFLFRVENRGKGDLVFEPDGSRLVGRDNEATYPVGWPDIETAYGLLGREVPPLQARARGLLLDGQKVVREGRSEEGVLLFRFPPAGTKRFLLEIALTLPDGSATGFGAPYRLEKK